MDGVREVDRCRTLGQGDYVPSRRKRIDLVGVDLEPQRVQELPRIGCLPLPIQQLPDPDQLAVIVRALDREARALALLVLPVGCTTVLRTAVHVISSDLQLDRL